MKLSPCLLSLGLILCSCVEPGDVVTGHARVLMKNVPSVEIPAPAPEIVVPEESPAPQPIVTQKQPVVSEPAPAPAPVVAEEEKPVVIATAPAPVAEKPAEEPAPQSIVAQKQPVVAAPAPAPAPKPVVEQKQPVVTAPAVTVPTATATVITRSSATPAPAVTQHRVVTPRVNPAAQQQPVTTTPSRINWNTPQSKPQSKRSYPIMPGQNRGLRNRKQARY